MVVEKESKTILHARLLSRTMEALHLALSHAYWVRQDAPITMRDSEPEPDISVVAGLEESYPSHPRTALLVVEISVSSLLEERAMAALYAGAGVAEYWLFNARSRQVEVFRQPVEGQYREQFVVPVDGQLESLCLPVSLRLEKLWEGLPFDS